jgi:hypothetical protein
MLSARDLFEKLGVFRDAGLRPTPEGEMGVLNEKRFNRTFIEEDLVWIHDVWMNGTDCSIEVYEETDERCNYIESKLQCLPFEEAWCYREPEYIGKTDVDIIKSAFNEDISWRFYPSVVKHMSLEDRERVYKHFEYMCYFVINVRDELYFDLHGSSPDYEV